MSQLLYFTCSTKYTVLYPTCSVQRVQLRVICHVQRSRDECLEWLGIGLLLLPVLGIVQGTGSLQTSPAVTVHREPGGDVYKHKAGSLDAVHPRVID